MKKIFLLGLFLLAGLAAAQQTGTTVEVGESLSVGAGNQAQAEAEGLLEEAEDNILAGESEGKNMDQARTHYEIAQGAYDEGDYEAAKVHAEEAVNAAVQAGAYTEEVDTETGQQQIQVQVQAGDGNGQGISAQVHSIIQERKGGTLEVPQGQMVRVVAQNRMIEVDNESIPLNATLRVRLRVQEKEHVLAFNASDEDEEIEIEEEGAKVKTKETLQIGEREMLAGGVNVTVLPAAVQEKVMLRKMDHVRLYVQNGNPYYDVSGTKAGKLLWLFDVEVPVQAQVHAQSGEVVQQQGPWWAFLVASE